jgi:hypothetical protein
MKKFTQILAVIIATAALAPAVHAQNQQTPAAQARAAIAAQLPRGVTLQNASAAQRRAAMEAVARANPALAPELARLAVTLFNTPADRTQAVASITAAAVQAIRAAGPQATISAAAVVAQVASAVGIAPATLVSNTNAVLTTQQQAPLPVTVVSTQATSDQNVTQTIVQIVETIQGGGDNTVTLDDFVEDASAFGPSQG